MNLNVDPKEQFGMDLTGVFGPPSSRKHIKTFTHAELKERIKKLPKYVSTDQLGDSPSLFEIANLILYVLQRTRALQGLDLDWIDTLDGNGLVRPKEMYKHVGKIRKNNKAQRGIQLRHLVEDILFKFNPTWVQTGLARYSKKEDSYYLNDAQHRYIGCIILGIREIPLEYIESEFRSVDVEQYSCVNLGSLVASEYDKYRTMVESVRIADSEGRSIEDRAFLEAWDVFNILQNNGCKLVEQSSEEGPRALECTGAGNLLKHRRDYGSEIFARAININASVFSKTPISTPNVWGICEFIKQQGENGILAENEILMDMAIIDALLYKYPNGNRVGFYLETKRAVDAATEKKIRVDYPLPVAAGIEKVLRVVHPEIDWYGIQVHGVNIAENYLLSWKVMPMQTDITEDVHGFDEEEIA